MDNEIKAAGEYKEKVRTSITSSLEKPKGVASLAKEVLAGFKGIELELRLDASDWAVITM